MLSIGYGAGLGYHKILLNYWFYLTKTSWMFCLVPFLVQSAFFRWLNANNLVVGDIPTGRDSKTRPWQVLWGVFYALLISWVWLGSRFLGLHWIRYSLARKRAALLSLNWPSAWLQAEHNKPLTFPVAWSWAINNVWTSLPVLLFLWSEDLQIVHLLFWSFNRWGYSS